MDEVFTCLNEVLSGLDTVADSTGIVRCILIGRIFENLKHINNELKKLDENWREERNKLETEIRVLKTTLSEMDFGREEE